MTGPPAVWMHRDATTRNLVKSLYLDPDELNAHNLMLKAKYERMAPEEIRYDSYNTDSDYECSYC